MNAPLPTRIFKSGNSLAVRIPKELAPADLPLDAEIAWANGVFTVRPLHKRKLTDIAAKFAAFSPNFMQHGRLPQGQRVRDWTSLGQTTSAAANKK
jgi:antitoxin VapB